MSVFENFEPPDFYNDGAIFGNLEVAMHTTRSRVMYSTIKPQAWKLASDIGGTLSLYTGFTLMGIVETLFFLCSSNLRNLAAEDEQTAVERKNPPIVNPLEKPTIKKFRKKTKRTITTVKSKVSQRLKPIFMAAKERIMKILAPAITYLKKNKYVKLFVNKSAKFVNFVKANKSSIREVCQFGET
uniref:Histone domain-containing protein n=1 Tax=Panagrellus redivivus TaxID=6233 RepID=A0A7E4V4Z7_PANRE